ncbi:MAG TPA: SRPBCC family protein [Caulobacteraceae bacterium]|nr:SRPBCC family protein [Caulobacteraceae bacterium]
MAESKFLYVTYIRASAENIWKHLTDPELNKLFWGGYAQVSAWTVGADWNITGPGGEVWDEGKVVAFEPPRRLVLNWRHVKNDAMRAEGLSTATFDLEAAKAEGVTKLTVTHTIGVEDSKLIEAVSGGWPSILASLKSLLETGQALG